MDDLVLTLWEESIWLSLIGSSPFVGGCLLVGLAVAVLQAVTQVHEQTLVFMPKLLATGIACFSVGPWLADRLIEFTKRCLTWNFPS
ncbi:MAG: flagellar biosynthetic protein FliQ [Myxococcales bacterium]|nr:flagellar biosynthetic protein FliQ [Myxococcales bacterium]